MMLILSVVLNNYIAKSKKETLIECCEEIVEYIDGFPDTEKIDSGDFSDIVESIAGVSHTDIFITDNNGKILICGCTDWQEKGSCDHSNNRILDKDLEKTIKEESIALSTLGIYENRQYVTMKPIYNSENVRFGAVYSVSSVSSVSKLLSTVVRLYIFSAFVPIVLMFLAIYAMIYRLTKPLKSMSEASKAMARGDFSRRIPVMSDDEIGELSMSFNLMTNNLSRLEGMRKSFVANISHELKTPMTTIGGFIDGILDGTIEEEKQSYYLGIVSEEVKRLSRLVESMLSMAKLESGEFVLKPELFDLREMILTIAISQEQRIEGKKIQINGLEGMKGLSVKADRDFIHQVVYNLVDNAIKFTNDDGYINFSLEKEGKNAVLTITNSGNGIPQKDLPFIFERFYKVDKSRSLGKNSTGLGLYIAMTIITAHKGVISVSSKENEFTTFKITLPIED